jgi:hypothetical protein
MLKALADPAAKVPPIREAIVTEIDGIPFWAKTRAGTVVMTKSSTTLNFIRSTYARKRLT